MDLSYKQEITVGGLVILAIGLFIVGTTWLSGRAIGGDSGEYWRVQFRDVAGLKVSSAVRVSGVPVGRVEEISLVDAGKVIVAISLNERIVPKVDAKAKIAAIGFVGDAVVDVDPGTAAAPLPKDRIIVGTQASGLTDRAALLAERTDTLLIGAQAIVNQRTADELYQTLDALQGTLKATERTMRLFGDARQGPAAELTATMRSLQGLTARFDSLVGNPGLARALNRSDTLVSTLTGTMARLDTTLAAINRGQGTLGRFATDSGLYYDMRDASQSLKQLLDELRQHPGKITPKISIF